MSRRALAALLTAAVLAGTAPADDNPSHPALPGLPGGGELSDRLRERLHARMMQQKASREMLERMKRKLEDAGIDPKLLDGVDRNPAFQNPDLQDRLARMFDDPKTADMLKDIVQKARDEERNGTRRWWEDSVADKFGKKLRDLKDADPKKFKDILKDLPLPQPSDLPSPLDKSPMPSDPPMPPDVPPTPSTKKAPIDGTLPTKKGPDGSTIIDPDAPVATKKATKPGDGPPTTRPGESPTVTRPGDGPPTTTKPGDGSPSTKPGTLPPVTPPTATKPGDGPGDGPKPATEPPSTKPTGPKTKIDSETAVKLADKFTDWLDKAPEKVLKDAPSWKKLMDSWEKSAASNSGKDPGKAWGDMFSKFGDTLAKTKTPDLPKPPGDMKLPSFKDPIFPKTPSMTPPSFSAPNLGTSAAPSAAGLTAVGGFVAILAVLGLLALAGMALWMVFGKRVQRWLAERRGGVELVPVVDPASVTDATALIRAFERLTLDQCGERARPWNHRRIAGRLGGDDPRRSEAARELSELYALARYAPRNVLPPEQLADARRHLATLTGVSPA